MRMMRFECFTERAFTLLVTEEVYYSLIAVVETLELKVSAKCKYLCCYLIIELLVKSRCCCFCTSTQSHFVSTDLHARLFPKQRNTTARLNITHNILVEVNNLKRERT